MALNPQFSEDTINAEADAISALLDNGYIRIYEGSQPVTADDAVGGDSTLLAELRFAADAFPAAVGGVLTANAITSDTNAPATGTAEWARLLSSDGATVVMDGTVGGAGDEEDANVIINDIAITAGGTVSISSLIIQVSRGGELIPEEV